MSGADSHSTFEVTQEALEALGWPMVVALWADQCRTPQGRARLLVNRVESSSATEAPGSPASSADDAQPEPPADPMTARSQRPASIFAPSMDAAQDLLAETSEARTLLDAEQLPPLGRPVPIEDVLDAARRGRLLEPRELLDVASCAVAITETRAYLGSHDETAPRLRRLGEPLEPCRELSEDVHRCIDRDGGISDRASAALARARRDKTRIASELQRRLERFAHQNDVAPHLSDDYVTVRNDRYVLPVRAESRGAVHGIVHDASRSGTTLFVEPAAVVDLNNQLKQADLAIERECERVLRELSAGVSEHAEGLARSLAALGRIDLAFARGRLSQRMRAVEPEVGRETIFELPGLRHPLLPADECVANDLRLGADFSVLVLSGPNAGGKTVGLKAIGLAALMVRAGLHVPCEPGARVDCIDSVLADIGDGQDIAQSLSTFSAHMKRIADTVRRAGPHSLVVLDEVGVGTDPAEGAALAQALLETLAAKGAKVVTTTHYNLLKEMAAARSDFENACVEFDPVTLGPTYRIRLGAAGPSAAAVVARRMGMPESVLERADALLGREDRRLEEALTELASGRAALEEERAEAQALHAESEANRDRFARELEKIRRERDGIYASMRSDLDAAFKTAHAEVAGLIRALQRGGSARQAAEVRERLIALEQGVEAEAAEQGITQEPPAPRDVEGSAPVDWTTARVGDRVRVPGGGPGVLESLPDRAGRVRVRAGSARLTVEAARLAYVPRAHASDRGAGKRVHFVRADEGTETAVGHFEGGGHARCDLRGRRVDEALDALGAALDEATADGRDELLIIHGLGTGALRSAVRDHLAGSPYVLDLKSAEPREGGDGVTVASLGRRGG